MKLSWKWIMKKYKVELNKAELCVYAVAYVWSEDTLGCGFSSSTCSKQEPCCLVLHGASKSMNFQVLLSLSSHHQSTRSRFYRDWLSVESRDLNTGPCACPVSSLSIKPFPYPVFPSPWCYPGLSNTRQKHDHWARFTTFPLLLRRGVSFSRRLTLVICYWVQLVKSRINTGRQGHYYEDVSSAQFDLQIHNKPYQNKSLAICKMTLQGVCRGKHPNPEQLIII